MRRISLATVPLLILATATTPGAATFYLHESASPVPVPGGSTTFVLDQSPPVAPTPVAEQIMLPKGTTASLPTFIASAFPAPMLLGLDFEVVLHLSGNHPLRGCATISASVERVAADGARSVLARATPVSPSIPQGGGGGTTGFAPVSLRIAQASCAGPFQDVVIGAGESIAVTATVSSTCRSNRSVSLAFDSTSAPGAAMFDPLPPPDPVELARCLAKCQASTSKALGKLVDGTTNCVLKCEVGARKGANPFSDCDQPYAGATAACIGDPDRGAKAKAFAAIAKACGSPRPCPPCYAGGDCGAFAAAQVEATETLYGLLTSSIVLCEETLDPVRTKCMDLTGKALSKFTLSKMKCYDKCYADVAKGKIAAAACAPPASDFTTAACIVTAEGKAVAAVNKACPFSAAPPCFPPGPGTGWMQLGEGLVDSSIVPLVYCSSPSGAFIDSGVERDGG